MTQPEAVISALATIVVQPLTRGLCIFSISGVIPGAENLYVSFLGEVGVQDPPQAVRKEHRNFRLQALSAGEHIRTNRGGTSEDYASSTSPIKALRYWYQLTRPGSRDRPAAAEIPCPLDGVIEPGCSCRIIFTRNQRVYQNILRPSADVCLLTGEILPIIRG
ncbi:hypothetical protein BDR22DRAFT_498944 [Usnea florida]